MFSLKHLTPHRPLTPVKLMGFIFFQTIIITHLAKKFALFFILFVSISVGAMVLFLFRAFQYLLPSNQCI